jgi:hypothetical protein
MASETVLAWKTRAYIFNKGKIVKPTKTFRLSKRSKTIGALSPFRREEQRHEFKHAMIQAQLASEVRPTREKKTRDVNNMPIADVDA